MVLQLGSGAVPEQQGDVPQPDSFPPKTFLNMWAMEGGKFN